MSLKGSLVGFVAVVGAWLLYLLVVWQAFPQSGDRGLFGDSFGALNTLFAGLAFAAIVITLLQGQRQLEMQKKELRLQRKELKAQRKEMRRSAHAQEASQLALTISSIIKIHNIKIHNNLERLRTSRDDVRLAEQVGDEFKEGYYRLEQEIWKMHARLLSLIGQEE